MMHGKSSRPKGALGGLTSAISREQAITRTAKSKTAKTRKPAPVRSSKPPSKSG